MSSFWHYISDVGRRLTTLQKIPKSHFICWLGTAWYLSTRIQANIEFFFIITLTYNEKINFHANLDFLVQGKRKANLTGKNRFLYHVFSLIKNHFTIE